MEADWKRCLWWREEGEEGEGTEGRVALQLSGDYLGSERVPDTAVSLSTGKVAIVVEVAPRLGIHRNAGRRVSKLRKPIFQLTRHFRRSPLL
jgi:hypothetical protein